MIFYKFDKPDVDISNDLQFEIKKKNAIEILKL